MMMTHFWENQPLMPSNSFRSQRLIKNNNKKTTYSQILYTYKTNKPKGSWQHWVNSVNIFMICRTMWHWARQWHHIQHKSHSNPICSTTHSNALHTCTLTESSQHRESIQIPMKTVELKGSAVSLSFQRIITHDKQGPVYQIYLVVASYSSHCIVFPVKINSFYKNTLFLFFCSVNFCNQKALSQLASHIKHVAWSLSRSCCD